MKQWLIKRLTFPRITIFILFFGFASWAFTKSDLYRDIARSQRLINEVYKYLITNYVDELNTENFTRASIKKVLGDLDPYTVYLEADEKEGIELLTHGEYGGVGIQLGKRDNRLMVIAPMEDTPAKRAGIISGDVIIKIDDESTQDMTLEEAAKLIRGVKGTVVKLTIKRFGEDNPIEFNLTRDNIQIKDVPYSGMINKSTGYILLTRFSRNSVPEMKEALLKMKEIGAEKIIIDLRNNPGGLLQAAVDILDMVIPKGEHLLTTRGRIPEANKTFNARKHPIISERVKIAVLINEGSASASEIVAGAIQDLDRGVIVGTRSFGKGLVQSVYALDARRSLKITTAKYYIPSGRLIQKPDYLNHDVVLEEPEKDSIFTTVGGRIVKGGGGIHPDYVVEGPPLQPLTRECWRRGLFFAFAQEHRVDYESFEDVQRDTTLLTQFADFLRTRDIDVVFDGETQLSRAREKLLKLDSTNVTIRKAFDEIEKVLDRKEQGLFVQEREDLRRSILMEFASLLEGTRARIQVGLTDDPVVEKALHVLNDQVAYQEVFQTPETSDSVHE
jgi:carboxyl-terminal processing protease